MWQTRQCPVGKSGAANPEGVRMDSKICWMGLLISIRYSLDIMSNQNSSYSLRISLSPSNAEHETEKDESEAAPRESLKL